MGGCGGWGRRFVASCAVDVDVDVDGIRVCVWELVSGLDW